ncbi:MAG: SDH family Clp fold serine proteinase [Actinomycetes bacterium]
MTEPSDEQPAEPSRLPQPPQTPAFRAKEAVRYLRQDAIKQIEEVLESRVICYIAADNSWLTRSDVLFFADLAHDLQPDDDVHFVISATGGDVDAAFRVVQLLRQAVPDGRLVAVVPSSATSAATLLAIGMDRILMSDTSELSPIDPLVNVPCHGGGMVRQPAIAYETAFKEAMEHAKDANDPEREVWARIVHDFDQASLVVCGQAIQRTRDYADALLRDGMFREGNQTVSTASFTQVTSNLMSKSRFSGHGAVITHAEAKKIGLEVDYLPRTDDLWQAFWRLYCLQILALERGETLFEGRQASLHRPA